jgi:outer membrane protein TolC
MSVRRLWLAAVLALAPIAIGAEETTAPSEPVYRAQKPIAEPVEPPAGEPTAEPAATPASELAEEPAAAPVEEPGQAAEEPVPEPMPEPVEEPPAPPARAETPAPLLHGTLALSLQDAIKMGLENNLDVQIDRYAPMIAELDLTAAWGVYDPELFAEMTYSDSKTPNSFAITGVTTNINRSTEGFGGLRGILPISGTQFSTQFNGGRSTSNSVAETLTPRYDSGWSVDVTQPVLRNLIWNEPWTRVKSSRLLHDSSEADFRRAVMDTVQRIEDAYWELIAAEEALRVANKSLETATALREQTQTQFDVGVVSKVEVTEADAGVSQRQVERIRTENQYRNQQDVLIDLVLGPNLRASSTLEIRPTDRPDDFTPYEVDVEGAVSRAFEHRPELAQAERGIRRSEVQLAFARNQRLPALDGVFRFGQTGLAGEQSSTAACRFAADPIACAANPPPNRFPGEFDDSIDDYEDYPQYVAGARLSIPFPNTTARASAARSELELSRAQTSMHRLEQQIVLEVRQAARNLAASQEGIVAARSAREAAAEQLRAEQVRLQYGESTPFDVLQREEALVARERDEIGAFRAYRTSVTALDRAQGTILRNRNIDVADVAPLR